MNATYATRTRKLRAQVRHGKVASVNLRQGFYSDSPNAAGPDFEHYLYLPTHDELTGVRARGYRAAKALRSHTGRATLEDISRATLVPDFTSVTSLGSFYA